MLSRSCCRPPVARGPADYIRRGGRNPPVARAGRAGVPGGGRGWRKGGLDSAPKGGGDLADQAEEPEHLFFLLSVPIMFS